MSRVPPLTFVIRDPDVIDMVTPAGLVEINLRTGKITLKVPEKDPRLIGLHAKVEEFAQMVETHTVGKMNPEAEKMMVSKAKEIVTVTTKI